MDVTGQWPGGLGPAPVPRLLKHPFPRGLHPFYPRGPSLTDQRHNDAMTDVQSTTETSQPSPIKEISRGAVQIAKEHIGRGPNKIRVTIAEDAVLIRYEESLSPAEKKLVADGDPEFVRLMRRRFQDAVRPDIVALVERTLGRTARTFLSDHDVVHDVGIELVLLDELEDVAGGPVRHA